MEDSKDQDNFQDRHLTTRRGFVTSVGFGVVSLYALWALYGAAPVSLAGIPSSGEGGGGGHGGAGGMSPEEFRRLTYAFIEANELPDGSVQPKRMNMAAMDMNGGDVEEEGSHEETATARRDVDGDHVEEEEAHGETAAAPMDMDGGDLKEEGSHEQSAAGNDEAGESGHSQVAADQDEAGAQHDSEQPIDLYILTQRYSFEPNLLRLERNVPYRFRMMAVDTSHGVSVLGSIALGGHIMRASAQSLSEMTMTFTQPGEHLVYCTVYCGEGHDMMQAKIIVA